MKIYTFSLTLGEKMLLNTLAKHTLAKLGQPSTLSFALTAVDADTIRTLNATHRSINEVTDVLSFPLLEVDGNIINTEEYAPYIDARTHLLNLGDIVVCRSRAREQAEQYAHSYKREFAFLALHGLLHLLGYDHQTEQQRAIMEQLQEEVLNELKITR